MTPEARQRRLESLVREARGRAERAATEIESRRGAPPAPGDLFVLAATAELPVEWAILDRDRRKGANGELLAVPADSHPLAGSADVSAEPGGTPVLRCRFGVWLDPALFQAEKRTGVLAAEVVAVALHRWRQLEEGTLEASPLAEEVDADPEYQDWIRDVPERARSLAARLRPASAKAWPRVPPGWARALAATLALLAVGLSVSVVQLRREVELLSVPGWVPAAEVPLGGGERGANVLKVPPEAARVVLVFFFESSDWGAGYLEIVDSARQVVWRSSRVQRPKFSVLRLQLPRELLPDGLYLIRLYPEAGYDAKPLASERLQVETEE